MLPVVVVSLCFACLRKAWLRIGVVEMCVCYFIVRDLQRQRWTLITITPKHLYLKTIYPVKTNSLNGLKGEAIIASESSGLK